MYALLLLLLLWCSDERIYTYPYSVMHRRLATAGIEVAPHFNQLLVADKSAACGRETHRKGISTEYHTDTHETENKCGVRRVTDA